MEWIKRRWLLLAVHSGALLPLALLLWDASRGDLTANPVQAITLRTGKAALVLLTLSLVCTPLSNMTGLKAALKLRKSLGLYAFFYVALHMLSFTGLDFAFDIGLIQQEIVEKRYILVGFAAFILLLPLAITSTRGWMRRLGKNWKRLHRLVYPAALLAAVHYVWVVKADIREPLLYGSAIAILLMLRVPSVRRAVGNVFARRNARQKSPAASTNNST